MDICQSLLLRLHRKEFLEDLMIGDDSWVLYDNATQHAVWILHGDEPPAVPKPDHHSHRLLLCSPLLLVGRKRYSVLGVVVIRHHSHRFHLL